MALDNFIKLKGGDSLDKELVEQVLLFIPYSTPKPLAMIKENCMRKLSLTEQEFEQAMNQIIEEGLVFEPKPLEFQRVKAEKVEKPENEEKTEKPVEKVRPKFKERIPLGSGQSIWLTLWENSLQLQRTVKQEDGSWETTQEINLARPVLEKLYILLPTLFWKMKSEEE